MGDLHFEGDPAIDSPRRHMERVLKGDNGGRRKWPFLLMALGGGGLWAIWRAGGKSRRDTADAKTTLDSKTTRV